MVNRDLAIRKTEKGYHQYPKASDKLLIAEAEYDLLEKFNHLLIVPLLHEARHAGVAHPGEKQKVFIPWPRFSSPLVEFGEFIHCSGEKGGEECQGGGSNCGCDDLLL